MTTVPTGGSAAPTNATDLGVESSSPDDASRPVTLRTLRRFVREGTPFACLTCYDATTARWLEAAGVPLLLVGDTAAEMILGLPGTIHAPLEFMLTLTAAVKRGAPRTFVMGDMPFMSYQADDSEALRNAGRFLTDGRADAVKLEVDRSFVPLVSKMARAGIPVVAHVGSRPQQVKHDGGYHSVGRTAAEARRLIEDAAMLEDAGAVMLLIEATPDEIAARIVERTRVPVIGCGAGPSCHGQIVVTQDLFGLTSWQPAFARPIAAFGEQIIGTARQWIAKVRERDLGPHPYQMREGELEKL
ncbi:MAG: 3-methyl-2-oxobutanoate hydroxymethyltransferase [Phycisphaerales bacterium]|nr:3-methyl-2-oxobutanoate hydroxymethyltransferase [Phycisphaerales bacterium]